MSSWTLGGYFQIGRRCPGSRSRDARFISGVCEGRSWLAGAVELTLGIEVVGVTLGVAIGVGVGAGVALEVGK